MEGNVELTYFIIAVIVAAASEIIAAIPQLKSNSVIQLILNIAKQIFKKKQQ